METVQYPLEERRCRIGRGSREKCRHGRECNIGVTATELPLLPSQTLSSFPSKASLRASECCDKVCDSFVFPPTTVNGKRLFFCRSSPSDITRN